MTRSILLYLAFRILGWSATLGMVEREEPPLLVEPVRDAFTSNPDHADLVSLIRRAGPYNVSSHYAETVDGYVLGLFRITNQVVSPNPSPPVVLQHGLLDSAATWVVNDRAQSLGFILADHGYGTLPVGTDTTIVAGQPQATRCHFT